MKNLDTNTINLIAEATDCNDHTGAILFLADALGNERSDYKTKRYVGIANGRSRRQTKGRLGHLI